MTPDDLARRLAAHPRWEWREGMRVHAVYQGGSDTSVVGSVVRVAGNVLVSAWWPDLHECRDHHVRHHLVPDLSDPATAGVLLAMLARDIGPGWRDMMCLSHEDGHWVICDYQDDGPEFIAPTLGEACARALLDVWGPVSPAICPACGHDCRQGDPVCPCERDD